MFSICQILSVNTQRLTTECSCLYGNQAMWVYCSWGSDKGETAVLPTGLNLDRLLEAGEEIFKDHENADPLRQGSVDFLSLARRMVEVVSL